MEARDDGSSQLKHQTDVMVAGFWKTWVLSYSFDVCDQIEKGTMTFTHPRSRVGKDYATDHSVYQLSFRHESHL